MWSFQGLRGLYICVRQLGCTGRRINSSLWPGCIIGHQHLLTATFDSNDGLQGKLQPRLPDSLPSTNRRFHLFLVGHWLGDDGYSLHANIVGHWCRSHLVAVLDRFFRLFALRLCFLLLRHRAFKRSAP